MVKKKSVKKKTTKKSVSNVSQKNNESKVFAFIATFFSVIGFVVALIVKREDKYVMFYAAQGLVVFIVAIAASIINVIVGWIPILGWLIVAASWILVTVLWLLSWIYSLSGEMKDVPLIGEWARKIRL